MTGMLAFQVMHNDIMLTVIAYQPIRESASGDSPAASPLGPASPLPLDELSNLHGLAGV